MDRLNDTNGLVDAYGLMDKWISGCYWIDGGWADLLCGWVDKYGSINGAFGVIDEWMAVDWSVGE